LFDFDTLVLGGSVGKNSFIKEFLQQELQKTRFNKNDIDIITSKLQNGSLEGTKYLI